MASPGEVLMDTIRDAILIGGKLTALNLPGGAEILQLYAKEDYEMTRDVIRGGVLAEVYCSYPDTFPTQGRLRVDRRTGHAYIAIRDHGYYGQVAASVLQWSEVAPDDRGKLIVKQYDQVGNARIPLDKTIDEVGLSVGTLVTWFIHPNTALVVADTATDESAGVFKPLLVYALPVHNVTRVDKLL